FKNTIIIMTSNVGSDLIAQRKPLGFEMKASDQPMPSKEEIRSKVFDALKEAFKPEFLNRIDEIILFDYLGQKEIKQIVDLELKKVTKRLEKAKGIKINFDPALKLDLATKGFDPNLGARPLKRVIQKMILDLLSLQIIAGDIVEGDGISATLLDGKAVFNTTKKAVSRKRKTK
ncbi:MAG: AAA family ATPase, partial [Candidatus Gribaldobacteria bacterium]|nr:AAA family ATPase [Candidatus Gribaldobacteria bacterium]